MRPRLAARRRDWPRAALYQGMWVAAREARMQSLAYPDDHQRIRGRRPGKKRERVPLAMAGPVFQTLRCAPMRPYEDSVRVVLLTLL
jgi:hypothetical protein